MVKAQKAGHTGTLDKLATGLLPICLGEATKFTRFGLSAKKSYDVTAELGVTTASGDADSDVIERKPVPDLTAADIETILDQYSGEIRQIPSMYSAIKLDGKALYKLARQGIEVERASRPVSIYENRLVKFEGNRFSLHVECSKGTYIRTLVEDIGRSIGCGAYVVALRRVSLGDITLDQAVSFEQLCESRDQNDLSSQIHSTDTMVKSLPLVKFPHTTAYVVRQGQAFPAPSSAPKCGWVRLIEVDADDTPQFIGIGEIQDGRVSPRRLISPTYS